MDTNQFNVHLQSLSSEYVSATEPETQERLHFRYVGLRTSVDAPKVEHLSYIEV